MVVGGEGDDGGAGKYRAGNGGRKVRLTSAHGGRQRWLAGTPAVPLHLHQSCFPPHHPTKPGTGQETTSWSPKICLQVTLQAINGGRIHSIYLSSPSDAWTLAALKRGSSQWAIAASFSRDRHRSSRHSSIVPSNPYPYLLSVRTLIVPA